MALSPTAIVKYNSYSHTMPFSVTDILHHNTSYQSQSCQDNHQQQCTKKSMSSSSSTSPSLSSTSPLDSKPVQFNTGPEAAASYFTPSPSTKQTATINYNGSAYSFNPAPGITNANAYLNTNYNMDQLTNTAANHNHYYHHYSPSNSNLSISPQATANHHLYNSGNFTAYQPNNDSSSLSSTSSITSYYGPSWNQHQSANQINDRLQYHQKPINWCNSSSDNSKDTSQSTSIYVWIIFYL